MVDFIIESSHETKDSKELEWMSHIDGASDKKNKGARIILKKSDEVTIEYALKLEFKIINNIEEYETLIKGLDLAKGMKLERLRVYSNL